MLKNWKIYFEIFYHYFFSGHTTTRREKKLRDNRVSSFYGIWVVVAIRWWKKVNLIAFVSCRYLSPYRINVIQSTDSASALSRFFFFARLLIIICIKPLFARCALSYLFKLTFSVISRSISIHTLFGGFLWMIGVERLKCVCEETLNSRRRRHYGDARRLSEFIVRQ